VTLNPLEEFVIARQLNDPNDVATYYVRAFVRNAKTDVLITTQDLEDKGSQRFTKTWQVPQDPTGLGFYITITSLVYTDANYTVLSTDYGSEQHEFLIQDRLNPYLSNGVSGPDIDYKKIREIVVEELEKLPQEKFDYTELKNGFESVLSSVKSINIPDTDLRPVLSQLDTLQSDIKAIKMPEIPETDFTSTHSLINSKNEVLDNISDQITELEKTVKSQLGEHIVKSKEEISIGVDRLTSRVSDIREHIDSIIKVQKEEANKPKRDILAEYLELDGD